VGGRLVIIIDSDVLHPYTQPSPIKAFRPIEYRHVEPPPDTRALANQRAIRQPRGNRPVTATPRTETSTRPANPNACCPRKACTTALVLCVELISDFHALLHDALRFKSAKARIKKIIHETHVLERGIKD
jgi:hypothetical protein